MAFKRRKPGDSEVIGLLREGVINNNNCITKVKEREAGERKRRRLKREKKKRMEQHQLQQAFEEVKAAGWQKIKGTIELFPETKLSRPNIRKFERRPTILSVALQFFLEKAWEHITEVSNINRSKKNVSKTLSPILTLLFIKTLINIHHHLENRGSIPEDIDKPYHSPIGVQFLSNPSE